MSKSVNKKIGKNSKADTKNEEYLRLAFKTLKRCGGLDLSSQNVNFNDSEMRLIGEVLEAKRQGERLISSEIARRLGLTRSAISQIVNRLVEKGAVKRVGDDIDRKIAYIETTDEMFEQYNQDRARSAERLGRVVEEFGEENFYQMCALLNSFMEKLDEERKRVEK